MWNDTELECIKAALEKRIIVENGEDREITKKAINKINSMIERQGEKK